MVVRRYYLIKYQSDGRSYFLSRKIGKPAEDLEYFIEKSASFNENNF